MIFDILKFEDLDNACFEKAFENMSQSRRERCLRYKSHERRCQMAFADMLAKKLIGRRYSCDPKSISLENLPSGRPVAYANGREVFVSLSHSKGFSAAAIDKSCLGIDIEVKRKINPDFIKRVLTYEEYDFVRKNVGMLAIDGESTRFLMLWSAKEAYLKYTGEGLSGFKSADVLPLLLYGEKNGLLLKVINNDEYICSVVYEK